MDSSAPQQPRLAEARRRVAPIVEALAAIYGLRDSHGHGAVPLSALLSTTSAGRAGLGLVPALVLNGMAANTLAAVLLDCLECDGRGGAIYARLIAGQLRVELPCALAHARASDDAALALAVLGGRLMPQPGGLRIELPLASILAGLQYH